MIHSKCGKKMVLDVSGGFKLISPGINITSKKILPGIIQLDACGVRGLSFYCKSCKESFETEKEIEGNLLFPCDLCTNNCTPSNIFIQDGTIKICSGCLELIGSGKIEYSTPKGKIYELFSVDSFNKKNLTSLLKIIMNSK